MEIGPLRSSLEFLLCDRRYLRVWQDMNFSAPYWRLYWNAERGAHVVLDGTKTQLTPDRLMLIPPNTPFYGRLKTPVHHLYLHFRVEAPFDRIAPQIFTFPHSGAIRRTLHSFCAYLDEENDAPDWEMQATLLVSYALCQLPVECLQTVVMDARVRACMDYLDLHLARLVSNDELARQAAMNTNAFIRLFEENVGESPQKWFRARRIERACILLHHSEESIERIAEECGFCDRYHFSRVFRQLRGISPAAFRKMKTHWFPV